MSSLPLHPTLFVLINHGFILCPSLHPPAPLLLRTTASLNLSHLASLLPLHASVPRVTGSRDAESRLGAAAPPCALFIAAPRCWAACVRAPCTTAGGVLLSPSHSLIIYTCWEGFLGCFFKEGWGVVWNSCVQSSIPVVRSNVDIIHRTT